MQTSEFIFALAQGKSPTNFYISIFCYYFLLLIGSNTLYAMQETVNKHLNYVIYNPKLY